MKELLDIRWVCAVCLNVFRAPLKITKRWIGGNEHPNGWEIIGAYEPICCGKPVLVAGEPKIDRWNLNGYGKGALVDPVENLRSFIKVRVA